MKTFYITKWALTKGILKRECEVYTADDATQYAKKADEHIFARIGKDAFEHERDAKIRMRHLIDDKLKSIDKSKAKLLKMREGVATL